MDDAETKARGATGRIFADLRDRRFLKWLFADRPEEHMIICHVAKAPLTHLPAAQPYLEPLNALDSEVQSEIQSAWSKIIATALREARAQAFGEAAEIAREFTNAEPGGISDGVDLGGIMHELAQVIERAAKEGK